MALFDPKVIRTLRATLISADVAFTISQTQSPESQARIAANALSSVSYASKAAADAGKAEAARAVLAEKQAAPPKAAPTGTSWDDVIQAGVDALD